MPDDDHEISFGIEELDDAFYSAGDWDLIPEDEWDDVDFNMDDVMNAFWNGFIDSSMDAEERFEQRELFFEYMELLGFESEDFDWDAWREAMGY